MVKTYLVFMVQVHLNFRLAELESLADLYGIKTVDFTKYDRESPFFIVELENDQQARDWISRSILTRAIYEYWGQGKSYEELHASVQHNPCFLQYKQDYRNSSFKFEFDNFGGSSGGKLDRVACIESFKYLDFQGPIRMKNPEQVFTIIEEYEPLGDNQAGEVPLRLFFGREVQRSDRLRGALEKYDLKKRPYKGTTSFEAELSLVSANIGQVKPGTVMYDPFAGTGSFLSAGGHYQAMVIGSDIDGRMIRGKGTQTIRANFKKYNDSLQFIDVLTMDFTHNALRSDFMIDTILCDPPYGIRESIKVLGAKDPERFVGKENLEINGQKAYLLRDYIPTKKPYSLDALLDDLLQFAAKRLPLDGRLAFWMPVANDENIETIIPLHSNLELKYNCVQEFNKWSRRLLVYINRGSSFNGPTNVGIERSKENFRDRYFNGFN
ncbi:LANO_0E05248g1_1 [Lachancea nothofagi CBS 11611]|uniref:tRNA (guanine(10)-N(2))-methyltransferase n=1 Tax=Lachancea nothofagi CBS 11611 TaxID=1266666 RepID=A0A1G4JSU1_9SACH|nr:LANO_0E05248g1_1 [Lachancea nothofagi CBS 11611]